MKRFVKNIIAVISLMFKKSSEGMAASTGLAVTPHAAVKPETENVVVKQQEDNYLKMTMEKSFRQVQYEQTVKRLGIVENPYLEWEKVKPGYTKDPLGEHTITEEQWKSTLKEDKK